MTQIARWVQTFAMAIGGPGLFLIALLDSSILSLPEINDFLLIWMVINHPARLVYYSAMSTLGSLAGCLLIYYAARKGGEALVRGRFHEKHVTRAMSLTRRYGGLVLFVPAVLPPPAPFKIFVLMAGVAAMPVRTFVLAIGVGRGTRYLGEALLALWWGERALTYVRAHGTVVALGVAAVLAIGGAYMIWKGRGRVR